MSELLTGYEAVARAIRRTKCEFLTLGPRVDLSPVGAAMHELRFSLKSATCAHSDQSAIAQAIGASLTGSVAASITIGDDFAASAADLRFALLAEVPLVIIHTQRVSDAGPSTDTDVALSRHISPQNIPWPVLVASDATTAYNLTIRAFRIAARLRTPVLLLLSGHVAVPAQTVDFPAHRSSHHADSEQPESTEVAQSEESRHSMLSSPSLHVGGRNRVGHTTNPWLAAEPHKQPSEHARGVAKLRAKMAEGPELPELTEEDLVDDAKALIVSYGATVGACREAVPLIRSGGANVSHLVLSRIWPVPEQAIRRAAGEGVDRVMVPELNTGLYADQIRMVLPNAEVESIARFDGRLLHPQTIVRHTLTHAS